MLALNSTFDRVTGRTYRFLGSLPGSSRLAVSCILASVAFTAAPAQAEPLSFAPPSFPAAIFQPLVQPQPQRVAPAEQAVQEADPSSDTKDHLKRRVVEYRTGEAPGTIIVDTPNTYLYYVLGGGKAVRYGIGVGRDGFTWSGVRSIERKAEWPDWTPPEDMIARQPYLPRWMAGGPDNPLGARAMYIAGTVYRIHGTNAPASIGKRMSSGCFRMLNADVIDLYQRVNVGTKVVVLGDKPRARTAAKRTLPRATATAANGLNRVY